MITSFFKKFGKPSEVQVQPEPSEVQVQPERKRFITAEELKTLNPFELGNEHATPAERQQKINEIIEGERSKMKTMTIIIDGIKYELKSLCNDPNKANELVGLKKLPQNGSGLLFQCFETKNFTTSEEIGRGGFSQAYKLQSNTGEVGLVFKKTHNIETIDEATNGAYVQAYLSRQCNNICKVFDVGVEINRSFGYSIMEPFDMDMHQLIFGEKFQSELINQPEEYGGFSNDDRYKHIKSLFYDIFSGLKCINEAKYIHRDIKFANIGILKSNGSYRAKIFDFDSVMRLDDENKLDRGTRGYIDIKPINIKSDVYSVGVMLYEWFLKNCPDEESKNSLSTWRKNPQHRFIYTKKINNYESYDFLHYPDLENLINSCINKNLDERFTAKEALESPWFKCLKRHDDEPTFQEVDTEYERNKLGPTLKEILNNPAVSDWLNEKPKGGGKRRTNRRLKRRLITRRRRR